jgi:hypothetical protein
MINNQREAIEWRHYVVEQQAQKKEDSKNPVTPYYGKDGSSCSGGEVHPTFPDNQIFG